MHIFRVAVLIAALFSVPGCTAVASTKAAKKEWRRIAVANEDLLSKLKLDIRRADLGARGIFYRVQAGTLESESAARDVCKALLERKVTCFVVPVK